MEDKFSKSELNDKNLPLQSSANRELKIKIVIGMLSVAILLLGLGLMYFAYLFNNSQKVMVDDESGANVVIDEIFESEGIIEGSTQDWKRYDGLEGIIFKYPGDYQLYADSDIVGSIYKNIDLNSPNLDVSVKMTVSDISDADEFNSLHDWIVAHGPDREPRARFFSSIKNLKSSIRNGLEVEEFIDSIQAAGNTNVITVVFSNNQKAYIWRLISPTTKESQEIFNQILSTFEFKKQAVQNKISSKIPSNWKIYDKDFAKAHFMFKYPPTYEIWDLDPNSGSIYLSKVGSNNYPIYLTIDTISNSGMRFEPYTSGSRRVWFKQNLEKEFPKEDLTSLTFEEVDFDNGKSYLLVSNYPEYFAGVNQYIGIQNGIPIIIVDSGLMPKAEIEEILSTLNVTD